MNKLGYSGTPLAKKLGIKEGCNVMLEGVPEYYYDLFEPYPKHILSNKKMLKYFIHFLSKDMDEIHTKLPVFRDDIVQNGMIWVSWPKKASKVATDVSENLIWNCALSTGLVDAKVCAIDNIWSGLKLVIPLKLRR